MADFDITGRIALNGEQLQGQIRKVTASFGAEFGKAGKEAGDELEKKLDPGLRSAERKIKETLKRAFSASPDAGIIDLDLPGLRASAQAMEVKAAQARQLATAIESVNGSTQNLTRAQQNELAAAQAVALKYEEQARAANAEVAALERLQAELGQTSTAHARAAQTSNTFRYGLQNAGYQVQDFFVQVAGGTSALRAFTLQAPQFIGSLQQMGNESGKTQGKIGQMLSLLSGPWGVALGIAIPIAGILAEKIFDIGEEAEKTERKVKSLQQRLEDLQNSRGKPDLAGDYSVAQSTQWTNEAELRRIESQLNIQRARLDPKNLMRLSAGAPEAVEAMVTTATRAIATLEARQAKLRNENQKIANTLTAVDRQMAAVAKGRADAAREDAAEEARRKAAAADRKAATADRREDAKAAREKAKEAKDAAREAERAAERAADAEKALREALSKNVQSYRDSANVERMRASMGAQAAERMEADLRIVRQFPELENRRVGEVIEYHGAQIKVTEELLKQYDLLRGLASGDADRKARTSYLEDFVSRNSGRLDVAVGKGGKTELETLSRDFEDLFGRSAGSIWERFADEGNRVIAKLAAEATSKILNGKLNIGNDVLAKIAGNASTGVLGAGATGGSSAGGAIGGVLGGKVGEKLLTKGLESVMKGLGDFAGPLGSLAGGVLGGLIGGLFGSKTKPQGAAVITSTSAPASVTGNNAQQQQAVTGLSLNLQSSLNKIIEALGGEVGSFAVSIGKREDYYRVSKSGSDAVGNKTYPSRMPWDVAYDGQDAAEALRIALLDALQDGAVKGIRQASERLLKAGQDLDANLSKALKFEQAFKDLKALTDPVGAALDTVNAKFKELVAIAKEGGAIEAEMAQLEELYRRERELAVKNASAAGDTLKSFLQGLKTGSSSPLSLRDQARNAQDALDPFRRDILAGKSVDTAAFQKAAQDSLSVYRELYGSTEKFFEQYDMITALTQKAIASIDAQASNPDDKDPFGKLTSANTKAAAQILEQQTDVMRQQTQLLEQIAGERAARDQSYLTADRGFL